jgi:hypothetical protein
VRDPTTTLVFGDLAEFPTATRRTVLHTIGQDDPWYLASERGASVAGLSGEDLAEDFVEIITGPPDGTHRAITVFDALEARPLPAMRPVLAQLVKDSSQATRQRLRALSALKPLSTPADQQELLTHLATQQLTYARAILQVRIVEDLPPQAIAADTLLGVLADYERVRESDEDGVSASLYRLTEVLKAHPRADLFACPCHAWRSPDRDEHSYEVDVLLDEACAALITKTPGTPSQVCRWLENAQAHDSFGDPGKATRAAVAAWHALSKEHVAATLDHVIANCPPDEQSKPWMAIYRYNRLTGCQPPAETLIEHALERASSKDDPTYLALAVHSARRLPVAHSLYWRVLDAVASDADLHAALTICDWQNWQSEQARRTNLIRTQQEQSRRSRVEKQMPRLRAIADGTETAILTWSASHYLNARPPDPQLLANLSDQTLASAYAEGWHRHASQSVPPSADTIGAAEATGPATDFELIAVAAIDHALQAGNTARLSTLPVEASIAALRLGWMLSDADRSRALQEWGLSHLHRFPHGAGFLAQCWQATLAHEGNRQLFGLYLWADSTTLNAAVALLLRASPHCPPEALKQALHFASTRLPRSELVSLAQDALTATGATGATLAIWQFVLFAARPDKRHEIYPSPTDPALVGMIREAASGFLTEFTPDDLQPLRWAAVVETLAPNCNPDDAFPRREATNMSRDAEIVRGALNSLTAHPDHTTTALKLRELAAASANAAWGLYLAHASETVRRAARDKTFAPPTPKAVLQVLSSGAATSPADLRAVITDELARIESEFRRDTSARKLCWNLDSNGGFASHLPENECRRRLLSLMETRLARYGIETNVEVRQNNDTRSDFQLSRGPAKLPIEIKRHYHPAIWTAGHTPLQIYADSEGAHGFGVYLVLWFGTPPTPARPDGAPRPESAADLQRMLADDLRSLPRTSTFVLDVSAPDTMAKARRKTRKKASPTA